MSDDKIRGAVDGRFGAFRTGVNGCFRFCFHASQYAFAVYLADSV